VSGGTLNTNATFVTATADAPFGAGNTSANVFVSAPSPAAASNFFYDPLYQDPYSLQWNLEVQRELARNLTLSAGYVGSHTLRLSVSGDYNTALTPGPGPITPRALWPHAPVTSYDRSIGQSKYNALQVKAERRLSKASRSCLPIRGASRLIRPPPANSTKVSPYRTHTIQTPRARSPVSISRTYSRWRLFMRCRSVTARLG